MNPQLNGAHSQVNNKLKREKNMFVWKPVTVLNILLFQNEITYIVKSVECL